MKKLSILILFILIGCGYKPSSHYKYETIGEKVFTQVDVSLSDPQNAVLTKDALHKAIYSRFKSIVTNKKDADSILKVAYQSIKFVPLRYDQNGYVVYYQAQVLLKFKFIRGNQVEEKKIIGRYEFPIRPSAIISTSLRFDAIQKGSMKALDEFIAYLETKGAFTSE